MASCSDSTWAATAEAYTAAGTDLRLQAWWAQQPSQNNFARQLAQSFGDQPTYFTCGIQSESTCTIAGCKSMTTIRKSPGVSLLLLLTT